MRSFLTAGALTAALLTTVNADLCSQGSQNINGNWYCQAVKRIHYTGVGTAGKYNKITSMNSATGACGSTPFSYSGPNAPLDEDVSITRKIRVVFELLLLSPILVVLLFSNCSLFFLACRCYYWRCCMDLVVVLGVNLVGN